LEATPGFRGSLLPQSTLVNTPTLILGRGNPATADSAYGQAVPDDVPLTVISATA
jgi:hypothetical protein